MKTQLIIAGGFMVAAMLHGQGPTTAGASFQYFSAGIEAGARVKTIGIEGVGGNVVAGRPLSATEERRTLQVLGDGTRIDNKETDLFYRDDQGRTRIEHQDGPIMIQNPVEGFMATLDPKSKSAHRMTFQVHGNTVTAIGPGVGMGVGANAPRPAVPVDKPNAEAKMQLMKQTAEFNARTTIPAQPGMAQTNVFMYQRTSGPEPAGNEENLGIQSINGVTAQGTRTTMTIPAGQIGNDKPIQIVSERWYSTDLQMLVKSTNSDPRFGETTYNLTNISQAAPDPSLFQIPADYRQ
jgi:hypothetical protein